METIFLGLAVTCVSKQGHAVNFDVSASGVVEGPNEGG